MLEILGDPIVTANIYTANHAAFPIRIGKITVKICGNFWVTKYFKHIFTIPTLPSSSDLISLLNHIISFIAKILFYAILIRVVPMRRGGPELEYPVTTKSAVLLF